MKFLCFLKNTEKSSGKQRKHTNWAYWQALRDYLKIRNQRREMWKILRPWRNNNFNDEKWSNSQITYQFLRDER